MYNFDNCLLTPNDKILDWFKLKAFADDKINMAMLNIKVNIGATDMQFRNGSFSKNMYSFLPVLAFILQAPVLFPRVYVHVCNAIPLQ